MTIKSEIVNRMASAIEDAVGDQVGVIKSGPLQDSPPRLESAVLLREMDPISLSASWNDVAYSNLPERERTHGFSMADEIGGARGWLLRGVIEMVINYSRRKLDRDVAFEEADSLRFSVQSAINMASANGDMSFVTTIGNVEWVVYQVQIVEVRELESGGPKAWAWRYALYYEAPAMETPVSS